MAVESGNHFRRCLIYMDMNMVRVGVVSHPSLWPHSGYKEIQNPRRKYVLISYGELMRLAGYQGYEAFKRAHHGWIEAEINDSSSIRKPHWTQSIAVGSKSFIEKIKSEFAANAGGRKARELQQGFELREPQVFHNDVFGAKN